MVINAHLVNISIAREINIRIVGFGGYLQLLNVGVSAQTQIRVSVQQQAVHGCVHINRGNAVIGNGNFTIAFALNAAVAPELQFINGRVGIRNKADAGFVNHNLVEIAVIYINRAAAAYINSTLNG